MTKHKNIPSNLQEFESYLKTWWVNMRYTPTGFNKTLEVYKHYRPFQTSDSWFQIHTIGVYKSKEIVITSPVYNASVLALTWEEAFKVMHEKLAGELIDVDALVSNFINQPLDTSRFDSLQKLLEEHYPNYSSSDRILKLNSLDKAFEDSGFKDRDLYVKLKTLYLELAQTVLKTMEAQP